MRLEPDQPCLFSTPVAQETIFAGDVPLTVHTFDPSKTTTEKCVDQYIKYSDSLGIDDAFNIVDLGDVIAKCHLWREKLPRVEPFYAIKCNPDIGILQTLANMGIGFDCASKEEISTVLKLGVSPDRIVFAHTCKPKSHTRSRAVYSVCADTTTIRRPVVARLAQALVPIWRLKNRGFGSPFVDGRPTSRYRKFQFFYR